MSSCVQQQFEIRRIAAFVAAFLVAAFLVAAFLVAAFLAGFVAAFLVAARRHSSLPSPRRSAAEAFSGERSSRAIAARPAKVFGRKREFSAGIISEVRNQIPG